MFWAEYNNVLPKNINHVLHFFVKFVSSSNFVVFSLKTIFLLMHTVCHHVLSSIRGYQCTCFVFATPSSSNFFVVRGTKGLHTQNMYIAPP
ncbi:hypothetical protein AB205_0202460 [Aquarana catesbeiana]|uniref:Uncharacterized protein n=1 Tax=Aquarana catesbeiana TaxID=8400 RepID=A0A2G9RUZ0_AQUCT|nr:hypothetical protein AB205_0202460 [Aquarana catesbeiana]